MAKLGLFRLVHFKMYFSSSRKVEMFFAGFSSSTRSTVHIPSQFNAHCPNRTWSVSFVTQLTVEIGLSTGVKYLCGFKRPQKGPKQSRTFKFPSMRFPSSSSCPIYVHLKHLQMLIIRRSSRKKRDGAIFSAIICDSKTNLVWEAIVLLPLPEKQRRFPRLTMLFYGPQIK